MSDTWTRTTQAHPTNCERRQNNEQQTTNGIVNEKLKAIEHNLFGSECALEAVKTQTSTTAYRNLC